MKRKMSDDEKTRLLSISISATVCASSLRRRPRGAAASFLPSPGCSSCRSNCSRYMCLHQPTRGVCCLLPILRTRTHPRLSNHLRVLATVNARIPMLLGRLQAVLFSQWSTHMGHIRTHMGHIRTHMGHIRTNTDAAREASGEGADDVLWSDVRTRLSSRSNRM